MKPEVVFVKVDDNDNIIISKEELEEIVEKSYNEGLIAGRQETYPALPIYPYPINPSNPWSTANPNPWQQPTITYTSQNSRD